MEFKDFVHHKTFVNGIRLHYRIGGQGNPIILMHGWLGTSYSWRKVAPSLAGKYTVVVPDLRGYGDSDKPETGYDGLTLVEDIRQLVNQLGLGTPHVVGHDMGALPAYLYAAKYPDEVKSLVYLDEPLPGYNLHLFSTFSRETFGGYWHFGFNHANDLPECLITGREREFIKYLFGLMLYDPSAITEEDINEYMRTYAAPGGVRGSNGCYRALLDTVDQFKEVGNTKLSLPVLAYGGEFGLPMTMEQMKTITENLTGGVIPKCGHLIPEEAPEFLVQELLKFWEKMENYS